MGFAGKLFPPSLSLKSKTVSAASSCSPAGNCESNCSYFRLLSAAELGMFLNITKERVGWGSQLPHTIPTHNTSHRGTRRGRKQSRPGPPFLAAFPIPLSSTEELQGQEMLSVLSLCPLQPGRSHTRV